jgi:hypothetical protein
MLLDEVMIKGSKIQILLKVQAHRMLTVLVTVAGQL